MDKYVLIPARLESSRLAKKALKKILDLSMVVHVALRAKLSKEASKVIVCTDSPEICWDCERYNIDVCMTRSDHNNGTERLSEAVNILNIKDNDLVVDLQGDEVFANPDDIDRVFYEIKKSKFRCVIPHQELHESNNPNRVKIIESNNKILYLTRADSPFFFGVDKKPLKKHLSIIGFKGELIKNFNSLDTHILEMTEKVELLRLLENGIDIGTFYLDGNYLAVDTIEDYEKSIRMMREDTIYEQIIQNII